MRILSSILALSLYLASAHAEKVEPLKTGATAPDFDLPGIDGQKHQIKEYAKADVLAIIWLSNHCPDSHASEGRVKKLVEDMKSKSFTLIAINPNNPAGLRLDELGYSKYNDSLDEMKLYAKEQGFTFPYLYDGETQATAHAYGCLATPHIFVFDKERKLRYQGRFDDSRYADEKSVTSQDARNAIEAIFAGKEVAVTETKVHGCSTKWMSKQDLVAKDDEKWAKGTVDVETIDAAAVAKLRLNPTNKVRMFNVWATWCGPCVAEFPELMKTSRKFGLRNFEFISISLDEPSVLKPVKAFLEKKHALIPDKLKPSVIAEGRTTNSYVFKGANQDELIKALDPDWKGPIPYTIIVAPGGKIVKRCEEPIENGDELRQTILDFMGRYYVPEQ